MEKQIMRALMAVIIVAAAVVTATAQTGQRLVVHVPFDFVVGGRQMRAGDYTVRRITHESDTALIIRGADGREAAMVLTSASGKEPSRAELTFRRYGEGYFLASVSIPGTLSVRDVPRSKSEGRLARALIGRAGATGGDASETVTVKGSMQ
jgi:hypothetical protein